MAANKFAAMLQKNTHKITVILVYAVLEWIMIFLLLLNSLFSFLISKFATYFGLKPPCLWCSRVDHILEPNKSTGSYRNLVCEAHAAEISRLRYCSTHRKLAEPRSLCRDCLYPNPKQDEKQVEISTRIGFLTWVSNNRAETDDKILKQKCSCCDESLISSKVYPSILLFKPSWGDLGFAVKGDLIDPITEDDGIECEFSDTSKSDCLADQCSDDHNVEEEKNNGDDDMNEGPKAVEEEPKLENFVRESFGICSITKKLIPVELINSSTAENQFSHATMEEEEIDEIVNSSNLMDEQGILGLVTGTVQQIADTEAAQIPLLTDEGIVEEAAINNPGEVQEEEEDGDCGSLSGETKFEIFAAAEGSVGKELSSKMQTTDSTPSMSYAPADQTCTEKKFETFRDPDLSVSCTINQGSEQTQRAASPKTMILASNENEGINHQLPTIPDLSEVGEEKFSEKKESAGTEESWDGSVISEMDTGETSLTIEKLKAALRAERKALSALYAELEEERSAAAIATNQTMAMITRLQEEKAAMQIEALQYQRMMEEQSEYDQEALQLLNELMIKREKENQELEKELETYRKKVLDYEAKEKKRMMRKKDGSVRSRNSSDGLCIDLNGEGRDEDGAFYELQEGTSNTTPIDAALNLSTLDESLAEFEEERLSILEELKALEEKLFILADNEEQMFNGIKDDNYGLLSPEENEGRNGLSADLDGKDSQEGDIRHLMAKQLLPLFEATNEGDFSEEEMKSDLSRMQNLLDSKFEEEVSKKLTIEQEVDHVYERLQALETDREFLKHCIGSLKKGDKGIELLQEILQHLRDLRTVEVRARSICGSPQL